MAEPSWFNTNENRAYPLVVNKISPPTALLVDAGFMPGVKSRFITGAHQVKLTSVRRQGSFFYVSFESDAPELFGLPLVFSRSITDGDFVYESVDSGTAGLSASSESRIGGSTGICDDPLWWGFIVTGRITAFESLLPADGEITYNNEIEPALIQNLAETYVTKLCIANEDRTRSTPPTDCDLITPVPTTGAIFVSSYCVTGDIVFVPGFNSNIRQSSQDNSVTLGAAVGDGAGQPCDTIALYLGETPPSGSTLLEGGLRCNETVRTINGLAGPLLSLIAGNGVSITSSPAEHTVIISVDMQGLALCYDTISARSESC